MSSMVHSRLYTNDSLFPQCVCSQLHYYVYIGCLYINVVKCVISRGLLSCTCKSGKVSSLACSLYCMCWLLEWIQNTHSIEMPKHLDRSRWSKTWHATIVTLLGKYWLVCISTLSFVDSPASKFAVGLQWVCNSRYSEFAIAKVLWQTHCNPTANLLAGESTNESVDMHTMQSILP